MACPDGARRGALAVHGSADHPLVDLFVGFARSAQNARGVTMLRIIVLEPQGASSSVVVLVPIQSLDTGGPVQHIHLRHERCLQMAVVKTTGRGNSPAYFCIP